MSDLDFSALTDDQLIGLVRAALQECVRRNPAVADAARAATIDEGEKARIAAQAAEAEAARIRAKERERIAKEATERVRKENEARTAESARKAAEEQVKQAVEQAAERERQEKEWIHKAALLVDRCPSTICVLYLKTDYGVRVLINPSNDRYDRNHLVDWNANENTIKTIRPFIGRKPALIEFCASFRANFKPDGSKMLFGKDYSWEGVCQTT